MEKADSDNGYFLFNKDVLEKLRCSECNNYLTSAPVRLLPNGNNICGQCTTEEPASRQVALEAVLEKSLFPCSYKKYGCEEFLLFGPNNHKLNCFYRTSNCPIKNCEWKGSVLQFFQHFKEYHLEFVANTKQFKIDYNSDKEEILMFNEEGVDFIFKYSYITTTGELSYDVRYCSSEVVGAFCRVCIIHCFDKGCNINVKGHDCLQFNTAMFSNDNQEGCITLNMNIFHEALQRPPSFIIEMNVKFIERKWTPELVNTLSFPSAFSSPYFRSIHSKSKKSLRLTKSLTMD